MFLDNKFKIKRIETGLKVTEVAQKLGIAPVTVWSYENGYRMPSRENLIKIAKLYKCPMEYFFSQ